MKGGVNRFPFVLSLSVFDLFVLLSREVSNYFMLRRNFLISKSYHGTFEGESSIGKTFKTG